MASTALAGMNTRRSVGKRSPDDSDPSAPPASPDAGGEVLSDEQVFDEAFAGQDKETQRQQKQLELDQALSGLLGKLDKQAQEQVAKKINIEERWQDDLRQFAGRYDEATEARLKASKKSRLFVNLTRARTHGWEARLCDMLFPTDDRNWAIMPTPLPTLTQQAREATQQAIALVSQANLQQQAAQAHAQAGNDNEATQANTQAQTLAGQAQPHASKAVELKAQIDEANKRATAMEKLIDDQLTESQYQLKMRQVIHDACQLGTGIMKGPLVSAKVRRSWKLVPKDENDPNSAKIYRMTVESTPVTDWRRVDPWNFFPDMSAIRPEDWAFTYERHLYTKKDLRKLAAIPGFEAQALKDLIGDGPQESLPPYIARLRNLNGNGEQGLEQRYWVWEYHGILEKEDIEAICGCLSDGAAMANDIGLDELTELPVIVWFCQGKVIKFGPHPLDSGDSLYSAFNFEKDETTVFGYGVPYQMRDSQAALNGAWRMIMDNGNVSTGPQIIVNKKFLEPQDGNWTIYGNKVWLLKDVPNPGGAKAFEIVELTNNQAQLAEIIQLARSFIDEETSLPLIAQGDQASHITQTKGGMSILMNSANVVFRRVVKNFDDDMTVPCIRRSYDWNMQQPGNDDAKGDYDIDARGSSVLLVREMQAQNLMSMALQFTNHPVLGPLTKAPALYRKLVQAHMLNADEIVKTDDEIAQEQASKQPPPDPEQIKADAAKAAAQYDRESELLYRAEDRKTALIVLAEKMNMTLDQLNARLKEAQLKIDSSERQAAAEAAITMQRDRQATASGQPLPKTAGGRY